MQSKERGEGKPPMFIIHAGIEVPVPCENGQYYTGNASMELNLQQAREERRKTVFINFSV